MASASKLEAFLWTVNEVELLLRLAFHYTAGKLQETRTQAVVCHCCCCCYETSQGSEVEGLGDGVFVSESMWIRCPHELEGCVFGFFHQDLFSKKCVFRIYVDSHPKRCNTYAFSHENAKARFCVDGLCV